MDEFSPDSPAARGERSDRFADAIRVRGYRSVRWPQIRGESPSPQPSPRKRGEGEEKNQSGRAISNMASGLISK